MFGDSDLPVIFNDFGVPVIYAGVTGKGIVDNYADLFAHGSGPGGFESAQVVLRIAYTAFPKPPQPNDGIVVDGLAYTVKTVAPSEDAAIIKLFLKGPIAP